MKTIERLDYILGELELERQKLKADIEDRRCNIDNHILCGCQMKDIAITFNTVIVLEARLDKVVKEIQDLRYLRRVSEHED